MALSHDDLDLKKTLDLKESMAERMAAIKAHLELAFKGIAPPGMLSTVANHVTNGAATVATTLIDHPITQTVTNNRAATMTTTALGALVVNPLTRGVATLVTENPVSQIMTSAVKTTAQRGLALPIKNDADQLKNQAKLDLLSAITNYHARINFNDYADENALAHELATLKKSMLTDLLAGILMGYGLTLKAFDDRDQSLLEYVFDLYAELSQIQFFLHQLSREDLNPHKWLTNIGYFNFELKSKAKLDEKKRAVDEACSQFNQMLNLLRVATEVPTVKLLFAIPAHYETLTLESHALSHRYDQLIAEKKQQSQELWHEQRELHETYEAIKKQISTQHRALRETSIHAKTWGTVDEGQSSLSATISAYKKRLAIFKEKVVAYNAGLTKLNADESADKASFILQIEQHTASVSSLMATNFSFVTGYRQSFAGIYLALNKHISTWEAPLSELLAKLLPARTITTIRTEITDQLKSKAQTTLECCRLQAVYQYANHENNESALHLAITSFLNITLQYVTSRQTYHHTLFKLMRDELSKITSAAPDDLTIALQNIKRFIHRELSGLVNPLTFEARLNDFILKITRDIQTAIHQTVSQSTILKELHTSLDQQLQGQQSLQIYQTSLKALTLLQAIVRKLNGGATNQSRLDAELKNIDTVCRKQYSSSANALVPWINDKPIWTVLAEMMKQELTNIDTEINQYLLTIQSMDEKVAAFKQTLGVIMPLQQALLEQKAQYARIYHEKMVFIDNTENLIRELSHFDFRALLMPLHDLAAELKRLHFQSDLDDTFKELANVDNLYKDKALEKISQQPQGGAARLHHRPGPGGGSAPAPAAADEATFFPPGL